MTPQSHKCHREPRRGVAISDREVEIASVAELPRNDRQ